MFAIAKERREDDPPRRAAREKHSAERLEYRGGGLSAAKLCPNGERSPFAIENR